MPDLLTPRLRLHEATPTDVPILAQWLSDPSITSGWGDPPLRGPHLLAQLNNMVTRKPGRCDYMAVDRRSGLVVGTCGVRPAGIIEGELGYITMPGLHRRHLAREMAAAVIDQTFDTAACSVVWAVTHSNRASQRVLESLGFTQTSNGEKKQVFKLQQEDWQLRSLRHSFSWTSGVEPAQSAVPTDTVASPPPAYGTALTGTPQAPSAPRR